MCTLRANQTGSLLTPQCGWLNAVLKLLHPETRPQVGSLLSLWVAIRPETQASNKKGGQEMTTTAPFGRYRLKPLEVEAMRFEGEILLCHGSWDGRYPDDWEALRHFVSEKCSLRQVGTEAHGGPNQFLPLIRTREGYEVVYRGDWIVRISPNEVQLLKDDDFTGRFEAVDDSEPSPG